MGFVEEDEYVFWEWLFKLKNGLENLEGGVYKKLERLV